MKVLARAIARQVNRTPFQYVPKRGPAGREVTTWRSRFLEYRWKSNEDPFGDAAFLAKSCDLLGGALRQLASGESWSRSDHVGIVDATRELFEWGGVLRGQGHNPPSIRDIEAVMLTALNQSDEYRAPLDSAWTKLAAISTDWLGADGRYPQVIFDSRVSVSLLEAIDVVCAADPRLTGQRDLLQKQGLGYVPGRGGNRPARVEQLREAGWRSGYGRWSAQFAASALVSQIVASLNANAEFEKMPTQKGGSAAWTTRGVEMVLFMNGY